MREDVTSASDPDGDDSEVVVGRGDAANRTSTTGERETVGGGTTAQQLQGGALGLKERGA